MSETPAQTRLAATVMLLRDATSFEVLMVKRHYQIDFASGALVFPGGKANDEDARDDWKLLSDGEFDGDALTARIAAVREAFEESGILLARRKTSRGPGNPLLVADEVVPFEHLRGPIDRREESFLSMVRDNDLILALDLLIHAGHWITPVMMPKRFDTHFYIAPTPVEQIATHDGRETTDTTWINPNYALEQAEAGEAKIIFPTRMVLGQLGEASSVKEAQLKFEQMTIVTVEPELSKDEDGNPVLRIPAEAGYMTNTERLDQAYKGVK